LVWIICITIRICHFSRYVYLYTIVLIVNIVLVIYDNTFNANGGRAIHIPSTTIDGYIEVSSSSFSGGNDVIFINQETADNVGFNSQIYFTSNSFTDNVKDVTIMSNDLICETIPSQIIFYDNEFQYSSGMYIVSVASPTGYTISGMTTNCSYVFHSNRFTSTNTPSTATIVVNTIGSTFIRNQFQTEGTIIVYYSQNANTVPLNFTLNNWNTMDYRVIDQRIKDNNDEPTMTGIVLYDPIYYAPSESFFHTKQRCFVEDGLCVRGFECFNINSTSANVCSGNTCLAPDLCLCEEGVSGEQCEHFKCFGFNSTDSRVCTGNGTCTKIDNCTCISGYSGFDCSEIIPLPSPTLSYPTEPSPSVSVAPDQTSLPIVTSSPNDPFIASSSSDGLSQSPLHSSSTTHSQEPSNSFSHTEASDSHTLSPELSESDVITPSLSHVQSTSSSTSFSTSSSTSFSSPAIASSSPEDVIRCFGILSSDSTVCSSNGKCVELDICICYPLYSGFRCNETNIDPISVQLVSNVIEGRVFNRGRQLYATANLSPADKISEMDMYWELYKAPNTLLNTSSMIISGVSIQSRSIVLKENSLLSNTDYLLIFNVRYRNSPDSSYTKSTMRVKTSSPPIAGSLSIQPPTGTAYNTTFRLQADNWTSNSGSLLYSFGYIRNNERITLVSNYSLNHFDTILPGGNMIVFVVANVLYGEQVQVINTMFVASANTSVLNFVQDRLKVISSASEHFDSDVTMIVSAIKESSGTLNQTVAMNIIDSIVQSVEQRTNSTQVAAEVQIQTLRVITNNVVYFSASTLNKVTSILTSVISRIADSDNEETLNSIVSATKNLAAPLLSKSSSNQNREAFVQLVNAFSPLIRKTLIEGQEKSISFDDSELLYLHTSRSPTSTVVLNVPEPNQKQLDASRRITRINDENIEITVSNDLFSSDTIANVPSLQLEAATFTNPVFEYQENNETKVVSSTISFMVYDSATDQELSVNDVSSLFTSSIPVVIEIMNNRTHYVCKYWDTEARIWSNSSICTTSQPTSTNPVVICNCSQPVTHLVSLDYIQAVKEEDEDTDPPITPNESSRKLGTAGIVLIILACLTPLVVMLATVIGVAWYLADWNRRKRADVYTPNQLDVVVQMFFSRMFRQQYTINM
jgi:hypothetical protein